MKKIHILLSILISTLLVSCLKTPVSFAPDHIFSLKEGELLVANRGANTLLSYKPDLQTIERTVVFDQPIADIEEAEEEEEEEEKRIWAISDGANGKLYELNPSNLSILSEITIGASPSAILYNSLTRSLWITHRFNNELWEVDPESKDILSRLEIGREPVDMVSFGDKKYLLVANNMPEMSSVSFPVASVLSIVDVEKKDIIKRVPLPNGSTDVKAIAVSGDQRYAYTTHLLARYQLPTNQVDRGWMSTNALTIIDLEDQEILTTVLLDTPQKGAANPWGIEVTNDNKQLVIAASGTHELVMIDLKGMHQRIEDVKQGKKATPSTIEWKDIPNDAGFLYGLISFVSTDGKGPRDVVIHKGRAFTSNYFTGELVSVNLSSGEKQVIKQAGTPMIATLEGRGEMFFHDASLCFQSWQSCASCHPNDARMDALNWDQKNDGFGNPKNTKSLLLSHETPPSMITGIRKDAETAVRAGYKFIFFAADNEAITHAMDVWLKSLKAVPSPYLINGKLSDVAQKGKVLFDAHCASCHSGPYYTDMKQYNVDWSTGADKDVKMDVPTLREVWRTAPYLYDGRAYTMREMLDIHGPMKKVSDDELNELTEYVLSL